MTQRRRRRGGEGGEGLPFPALIPGLIEAWTATLAAITFNVFPAVAAWRGWFRGLSIAQATAAQQPLLSQSDPNLNGRSTVVFDGVDDFLSGVLSAVTGPCTLVAVARATALGMPNGGVVAITNAGAVNTGSSLFIAGGNLTGRRLGNGANDSLVPHGVLPQSFYGATAVELAGSTAQYDAATGSNGNVAPAFAQATVVVGALSTAPAIFPLAGSVPAVALYNRALSARELNLLHAYYSAQYGTP